MKAELKKIKFQSISEKAELIIAVVLFILMLVNCGRYIDIRINGRSNSLSPMPENDKRILLQISSGTLPAKSSDLICPIFAGFKTSVGAYAASFEEEPQTAMRNAAMTYIPKLFSGRTENVKFDSEQDRNEYIENLKNAESYILLSYFSDIPAAAFLPSVSGYAGSPSSEMYFNVQNLYILPDKNQNAVGIAVSSELDVNIIYPSENVTFNVKELEAYNSSTGFVAFEYAKDPNIIPVFSQTLKVRKYRIETALQKNGKQTDSIWIKNTLDAFGLNINLAKTFVTRDGSVINYVDGENELLFYQNGNTVFNTSGEGIELSEFLGYKNSEVGEYSFAQKISAVKNLVNLLPIGNDAAKLCLTSVKYDYSSGFLTVGLKYFANGVVVTQNDYDASFVIGKKHLVYAMYSSLCCTAVNAYSDCMPQKYAVFLSGVEENALIYALLTPDEEAGEDIYKAIWAFKSIKSDGQE